MAKGRRRPDARWYVHEIKPAKIQKKCIFSDLKKSSIYIQGVSEMNEDTSPHAYSVGGPMTIFLEFSFYCLILDVINLSLEY